MKFFNELQIPCTYGEELMFLQGNPDPLCLINEKQVSKIFPFSKMTEE
tara:strand:+ start:157 stop:300 length:144 start_codon:yes stop_codon:yes gene_type:complete